MVRRITGAYDARDVISGVRLDRRPEGPPFSGELYDVRRNGLFVVDDASVWFVVRGVVDLYSMAVLDGTACGPRHHLLRVGAGRLLLGLGVSGASGRRLVAAGSDGARLVRAPKSVLAEGVDGGRPGRRLRGLLEAWIDDLYQVLVRGEEPPACSPLGTGLELKVDERARVRPEGRLSWILPMAGRALVQGRPELPVEGEGYFPVSPRSWVELEPGSWLYVSATDGLTSFEAVAGGLRALGRMVWGHAERQVQQQHQAHAERAEKLAAAGETIVAQACARLAATALTESHPVAALGRIGLEEGQPTELLACCRLVGAALGVPIQAPPPSEARTSERDPLAPILRSSHLRARQVALRGRWWQRDQGPLLGTWAADHRPLALLRRDGRYTYQEADGTCRPVTGEVADRLAPFAQTFYAPLPDPRLGWRALVRFAARGCRADFLIFVLLSLAATGIGMLPSVATGILFNDIIPGAHRSQLYQMTIILVVTAVASTGLNLVKALALLRIQQRTGTAVQAAVWDRLMRLPLSFFRPYTAGDLATRAMAIDAIQHLLSTTSVNAILGGIFSLANVAMMFYYSPAMAWRGLALIAVAVVVTAVGGLLQLGSQRGVARLQAKTSGLVLQLLTSIAKLRVAGAEARAFSLWVDQFAAQRRLQLKVRRIANVLTAFFAAFPIVAYVFIYWAALGLLEAATGPLRAGDFLAFGGAFTSCLGALLGTCMALVSALAAVPLYEQARPILEGRPEVAEGLSSPGVLSGTIELQNVSFRYSADGPPVLRDISLAIKPGEFVALVGPSGSGKSTLLRLLLGFEKAESGGIYYDGQEIGSLDVQAVRRQMGVVLQNGSLVAGDLFTNIAGSTNCTMEEAWEAAALANIAEDIKAMPMQMHTVISEGASTLSGGQRQRLMIARAVVNSPTILLLDEATSALDNRTQAQVSASLEKLRAARVVVAHRLSTIVNADRIVVIDEGRIVQTGTYAELIAEEGVFAQLARRQLV